MDSVSKAAQALTVQLGYAEALTYARHLRLVRLVDYERTPKTLTRRTAWCPRARRF